VAFPILFNDKKKSRRADVPCTIVAVVESSKRDNLNTLISTTQINMAACVQKLLDYGRKLKNTSVKQRFLA
jgi:hypothetical protein